MDDGFFRNSDGSAVDDGVSGDVDTSLVVDLSDDSISDLVEILRDTSTANEAYTESLQQIAELVSYQDMQLVALNVSLILFMGLFCGWLVTRWMRNRN